MSSPAEDQKTGTYLEREAHIQSPAPHYSDLNSDTGSSHISVSPSISEHSQYPTRPASSASQTGSMYGQLQQPPPPQHRPQYQQQHIQAPSLNHYQNNHPQQQQQFHPLAQQHTQYYTLQQQHEQQQHHEHEMHLQQQQLLQQQQQQPQLHQQERFEEPQRETKPASSSGQVKSQVCGTCSKAFARRSDLARHGTHCIPVERRVVANCSRTYSLRPSTTRLRPRWLRKAVHPAFGVDCACAGAHWRETSYVRDVLEGLFPPDPCLLAGSC